MLGSKILTFGPRSGSPDEWAAAAAAATGAACADAAPPNAVAAATANPAAPASRRHLLRRPGRDAGLGARSTDRDSVMVCHLPSRRGRTATVDLGMPDDP